MRDVETIDRELSNLASVRFVIRECDGKAATSDEVNGQVDELLDERNLVSKGMIREESSTRR